MSNLLDLKDKTAAVIGASSGIGRAVSLLLAEHGANVVLCARRTDKLEETAALIRAQGGRAVTVAGDAVLPETHETVVRTAQREFGGLDIAINNAGTLGSAPRKTHRSTVRNILLPMYVSPCRSAPMRAR